MTDFKKINTVIVLVLYLALATPVQAFLWFFNGVRIEYARWILVLNCGPYLQALAILATMAVLRSRLMPSTPTPIPGRQRASHRLFVIVGIASGLLVALAWYYGFRFASDHSGQRAYIFGLRYFPGYAQLRAGISYYRFFSVFIAIYLGILAGDHAWRSSPHHRLFDWTPPPAAASASAFAWDSWVLWLTVYRLSEWIYVTLELAASNRVVSLAGSYLSFFPLFVTSTACVPVSYWLFGRSPKTRNSSISGSQAASFLIPILAALLLLPGGFLAFAPLVMCVGTLNVAGFVWGWVVGDLRWRSLQSSAAIKTTK